MNGKVSVDAQNTCVNSINYDHFSHFLPARLYYRFLIFIFKLNFMKFQRIIYYLGHDLQWICIRTINYLLNRSDNNNSE